ncbi:hypothetical protein CVR96_26585 [Salmonella enterica subsp. enterica serovar Typhimurium]|nr:hypothetical protein CVR96_26585 [Salmonella enterica subsp. enterica serovar Typhimurium]
MPADYADNTWLTEDYLYQIEVWSKNYADVKSVSDRIRAIMWNEFGFRQGSGVDEYDLDFKVYRDARRYSGKVYVAN